MDPMKERWLSSCLFELTVCPEHKHFPDIIITPLLLLAKLIAYRETDKHTSKLEAVCVYLQPYISRNCCAPDPGVWSQVFYDRAGLECPTATHARHHHYYHFTNTHMRISELSVETLINSQQHPTICAAV